MKFALAVLLASASIAHAATITGTRLVGESYALDPDQFEALAPPTPRGSVTTACGAPADGSRAILKCGSDAVPDGRYSEVLDRPWIDSADLAELAWNLDFGKKVKAFGFGVTDANDQPGSHWSFAVEGASTVRAPQFVDEGGPIDWYFVLFDEPVSTARLEFSTTGGDGFGIPAAATLAAIPLPPAGLLLLGAVGALAAARRLRRKAAEL